MMLMVVLAAAAAAVIPDWHKELHDVVACMLTFRSGWLHQRGAVYGPSQMD
jgi:hypothetical protein